MSFWFPSAKLILIPNQSIKNCTGPGPSPTFRCRGSTVKSLQVHSHPRQPRSLMNWKGRWDPGWPPGVLCWGWTSFRGPANGKGDRTSDVLTGLLILQVKIESLTLKENHLWKSPLGQKELEASACLKKFGKVNILQAN